MPLIDTTKSSTIGFRPATALRYFSTPRRPANELRVAYELVGFNESWHVFDPALEVAGTRHVPALLEFADSADGKVRSIEAVYELPSVSAYRHDIIASTKTAAKVFDISSVIEVNAYDEHKRRVGVQRVSSGSPEWQAMMEATKAEYAASEAAKRKVYNAKRRLRKVIDKFQIGGTS